MKIRDAVSKLREAGFAPDRTKGSHQTWVKGDQSITVVINHMNDDAPRILRKNVTRVLQGLPAR